MTEVCSAQRGDKEVKATFAFHILSQQKIKELISRNAVSALEPVNIEDE